MFYCYDDERLSDKLAEIRNEHYQHHTSYKRGYHTVKGATIHAYNGKFGRGYTVEHNASNTTNYHFITYFIER